MKVGFDGSLLRGRRTGINNYCYNILLELTKADAALRFLSAELGGWHEVLIEDAISQPAHAGPTSLVDVAKRSLRQIPGGGAFGRKLRKNVLLLSNRSKAINLFHAFGYVPHFDVSAPILPVVYDLSFIRHPEMHPRERVRNLSSLPSIIERSAVVQTISEFSKQEIVDVFGYPKEKILVAYPGAARIYRPLGERATTIDLKELGLIRDHYLLAVGTLEPRKNLKTLILAYSRLPADDRTKFPLVIVGGKGWGGTDFPKSTSRLVDEGSIRFFGFLTDSVLRSLYEGTRLMLYPSIYEGFGMPVVEAMACGAPVVHSSNTSMDEITNDCSAGVPPLDVDAWTNRMQESISSAKVEAEETRQKRIERASLFDWAESAKIVRGAYDIVAQSYNPPLATK